MENNFKITICQPDLSWEKSTINMEKYDNWLHDNLDYQTDLILFPEMFLTGFSMKTHDLAETMDGASVTWMQHMAREHETCVAGSHMIKEFDQYYNRFIFTYPSGKIEYYDKRHLFRMGEEQMHYSNGNTRKIIEINSWRLLPIICYDLRFPVWLRNRNDYDVLICIANWPSVRQPVWNNLLIARAIENLSYVVGVNRVGTDGMNIRYQGGSQAIDPKGHHLLKTTDQEGIYSLILEKHTLIQFREKFPAHLDADDFTIK
jgi:predicted amidohydrolase